MGFLKKLKGFSFESSLGATKELLKSYLDDFIELKAKEKIYKEMLNKLHDKELEGKYSVVKEELEHRKKVLKESVEWFEKAAKEVKEVLKE